MRGHGDESWSLARFDIAIGIKNDAMEGDGITAWGAMTSKLVDIRESRMPKKLAVDRNAGSRAGTL